MCSGCSRAVRPFASQPGPGARHVSRSEQHDRHTHDGHRDCERRHAGRRGPGRVRARAHGRLRRLHRRADTSGRCRRARGERPAEKPRSRDDRALPCRRGDAGRPGHRGRPVVHDGRQRRPSRARHHDPRRACGLSDPRQGAGQGARRFRPAAHVHVARQAVEGDAAAARRTCGRRRRRGASSARAEAPGRCPSS